MILRRLCIKQARSLFQSRQLVPLQPRFLSSQVPTQSVPSVGSESSELERPLEVAGEAVEEGETDFVPEEWGRYKASLAAKYQFTWLGSQVKGSYRPDGLLANPPRASQVTLELLLASQSHIGHSTSLWNPGNSKYIFGIREGVHIISLDATAAYLRRAAMVVEEVAYVGGIILFVGTRKGQKQAVIRAAELAQGCHVFTRWAPGTITNSTRMLGKCEMKLVDAADRETTSEFFDKFNPKMPPLKPDLVICFNPLENEPLLRECAYSNIPTIGVIDTDADPTQVTYPIPANDDSPRCATLIASVLGRAGQDGQVRRLKQATTGRSSPYEYIKLGPQNF